MVDFSFSEEEEVFRQSLRDLLAEILAPRAREIDTERRIPDDVIRALADNGILCMTMKPEHGGSGASWVLGTIAIEEIARADPSVATAVFVLVENSWGKILDLYGRDDVAREVLSAAARGEGFVGINSTEPQSGSDVAGFTTRAVRDGDHWVINGEKAFISGIAEAQRLGGGYITVVKTRPEAGSRGITLFYVPIDAPGITVGFYEDMGRNGLSTGWMKLKDVRIPDEYRIGEVDQGFKLAMEGFNRARIFVSAGCLGSAEAMLEYTAEYARNRVVFNRPLAKFEGIQFPLVDAWTELEATKLMIYKAAWAMDQYDAGRATLWEAARWAAMAKLLAPERSVDAIKEFMKVAGAYGYTKDSPLEMAFRGVMSYFVGAEGGQNIMRLILARELVGKENLPYK